VFDRWRRIEIDPSEAYAANALRIGDAVVYPAAFPRTGERLVAAGLHVVTIDVSELAKAEGAVTCCSLLID
jgi:dimethylargininase